METNSTYTEKSYRLSKLILYLLTFAAFAVMVNNNPVLSRYLFGLPIIISGLLGVFGSFILYKGREEPINEKKIIAITVNSAMVILIVTIIVSNTLY
ncbi:hypothetical protein [Eudoraea sp.]|uniref:hypothetical protein n=1 Tax=Eudoraea sp. TaxID=1979955 RepID=UPI003C72C0DF